MSLQPENQNVIDIIENITELMNNSQTGRFDNTYNESTPHNSIQSPSTSTLHYVQRPRLDVSAPPSYEDCTDLSKLPTYEEIYMETSLEGDISTRMPEIIAEGQPNIEILPPEIPAQTSSVFTIDAALNSREIDILGTNLTFLIAFLVAYIFNWFGCLVLLSTCQTVAARYGAIAGFGLSLARWTMKVKQSNELYVLPENRPIIFICWLFITTGSMICICFVVKYFTIKHRWSHLSVRERARVLYFC